jgi:hypothetical protein
MIFLQDHPRENSLNIKINVTCAIIYMYISLSLLYNLCGNKSPFISFILNKLQRI